MITYEVHRHVRLSSNTDSMQTNVAKYSCSKYASNPNKSIDPPGPGRIDGHDYPSWKTKPHFDAKDGDW